MVTLFVLLNNLLKEINFFCLELSNNDLEELIEVDEVKSSKSDELMPQAIEQISELETVSVSLLQRKLRIGYNREARIIETMEMARLVSEMSSNGSREVLVPQQ